MIGILHDERHSCGDDHLPNCYNPNSDLTACTCGEVWWRGRVGTWHSGHLRRKKPQTICDRSIGTGAVGMREEFEHLGWDRYFLHLAECVEADTATAEPDHLCRETATLTTTEAFGGAA